ncbi:hypothetical protein Fmac_015971 [Flemingia macrophylla]|uniref:ZP domain-containing protein n=1 Tax=Flemingia macrophylla TaxID=520843 RepID=A0ABD1MGX3_9FABA
MNKGIDFSVSNLSMVLRIPIAYASKVTNGIPQALKLFENKAFTCEYKSNRWQSSSICKREATQAPEKTPPCTSEISCTYQVEWCKNDGDFVHKGLQFGKVQVQIFGFFIFDDAPHMFDKSCLFDCFHGKVSEEAVVVVKILAEDCPNQGTAIRLEIGNKNKDHCANRMDIRLDFIDSID